MSFSNDDASLFLKAMSNELHADITELTYERINSDKLNALREIGLSDKMLDGYTKQLESYRYIDELHSLKNGSIVRWINLERPEPKLFGPMRFLCVKFMKTCVLLCMSNFKGNGIFTLKFDTCLIFQKLSSQEQIMLRAIEYLTKKRVREEAENDEN